MSGKRFWSLMPLILVGALIVSIHFSLPPEKAIELKRILGTWEGDFTRMDKSKSFPISVVFRDDGTYQFDSVLRRSEGKIEIDGRKVFLIEEGLRAALFTLDPNRGKPILLGKIGKVGSYRLSKLNEAPSAPPSP